MLKIQVKANIFNSHALLNSTFNAVSIEKTVHNCGDYEPDFYARATERVYELISLA